MVTTVNIIGGKWKPILLHMLSSRPMRHGELRRNIPPISQKVLTQQLRELETDGIVARTIHPTVPPAVEYHLTPKGETLKPLLESLYTWGEQAGGRMGSGGGY